MGINLKKAVEQVEESFVVKLQKKSDETNIEHTIECEVKFAVDISGSMNNSGMSGRLYDDGTVNEVVSRFFAVAKVLDDNEEMEVYPFSSECEQLDVPVTEKNYEKYVKKEIMEKRKNWYFGGTTYVPMIQEVMKDCSGSPQLILCVVDGDTRDERRVENLIIESSGKPVFWFFIGIGKNERFEFLEKLDDIPDSKRVIDNVDFKEVGNISKLSDKELYDMIADEFIDWFYAAKAKGIF